MFNYPVEKHILRFYKYKFLGYESKPIVIEAYNKLLRDPSSSYKSIGKELFSVFAGGNESWLISFPNWTFSDIIKFNNFYFS